jgi:hypothetical protein
MAAPDILTLSAPIYLKLAGHSPCATVALLITGGPGFGSGYHRPHPAEYARIQLESEK